MAGRPRGAQEAAKKGKDAMLNEHERHQIELNSMRQSSRKQHQKMKELLPALLAPWPQHCCRRRDLERAYRNKAASLHPDKRGCHEAFCGLRRGQEHTRRSPPSFPPEGCRSSSRPGREQGDERLQKETIGTFRVFLQTLEGRRRPEEKLNKFVNKHPYGPCIISSSERARS